MHNNKSQDNETIDNLNAKCWFSDSFVIKYITIKSLPLIIEMVIVFNNNKVLSQT